VGDDGETLEAEDEDEDEDGEVEEVVTYSNGVPPTQMLQESEYGRATVDEVLVSRVTVTLGLALVGWLGASWYGAANKAA
jgi:hypothetical protein